MSVVLDIGKVVYIISGADFFHWKDIDKQFILSNPDKEILRRKINVIDVTIVPSESFSIPEDVPNHTEEDKTQIWEIGNTEVRLYRAVFLPGCPIYAMSTRYNNNIQIKFDFRTGAWNSPNMLIWNLIHLETTLLEQQGMILHCCYMLYKGKAILFTAPSGTGKTTQANIWKNVYGTEIINGDKCLLQNNNGQWEAWGFPLHGSADECLNRKYPIGAIVVVRQSPVDQVIRLNQMQKIGWLYSEITVNHWNEKRVQKALDLLEDLISKIPVVQLNCTMNNSAAVTLCEYLKEYF